MRVPYLPGVGILNVGISHSPFTILPFLICPFLDMPFPVASQIASNAETVLFVSD
jgi:hypothetical protein